MKSAYNQLKQPPVTIERYFSLPSCGGCSRRYEATPGFWILAIYQYA
jgi:hypothetical protein